MPWIWPWEVWNRNKALWDALYEVKEEVEYLEEYLKIKKGYSKMEEGE